jgi:hypothetical protein
MPFASPAKLLGVDITSYGTTQEHTLGTRVFGDQGQEYVYVRANGAITAKMTVKLESGYDVAASSTGRVFGIALVTLADNEYGWVQTRGLVPSALATTGLAQYALIARVGGAGSKVKAAVAVAEGGATSHAIGDQDVIGQAQAAESGGVADVYLF